MLFKSGNSAKITFSGGGAPVRSRRQTSANFRSANDDRDVGSNALESGDNFRRLGDVPNVNAQPDNSRSPREQHFDYVDRSLVDVEFGKAGPGLQFAEVGQKITQAKRGM